MRLKNILFSIALFAFFGSISLRKDMTNRLGVGYSNSFRSLLKALPYVTIPVLIWHFRRL